MIPTFIQRWIDRIDAMAGIINICLGLAAFGIFFSFGHVQAGIGVALLVYAVGAGLERFHVQRDAELRERLKIPEGNSAINTVRSIRPDWNMEVVKEFDYAGFHFRAFGFVERPIAYSVTSPHCPACHRKLSERTSNRFPGRLRIEFLCECGFHVTSKFTSAELISEAMQISNIVTLKPSVYELAEDNRRKRKEANKTSHATATSRPVEDDPA